jgi:hypothetical protein
MVLPATALAGLLVLLATPAAAQDPASKAQAVQLFDAADKLMLEGKVAAACPKYAASMKLDPQLGALLHLADCYSKNGQLASAWGAFREAEEMAHMKNDDRASFAHDQAAQLEPRLSHLTVSVPDSSNLQGLEVRIDGAPVTSGAWGIATPIDTGSHGVEARAPGHETWSSSVVVTGESQEVRVEVPLLTESAAPPPTAAGGSAPVHVQVDDSGSPIRTLGWVGIGVGAASVGLGAVFLVQKNSKVSERDGICPTQMECTDNELQERKSLTSDARTADTLSIAGFVVGGALVVGGVAAVIFAPKAKAKAETAWLLPAVSPHVLGVAGGMTW